MLLHKRKKIGIFSHMAIHGHVKMWAKSKRLLTEIDPVIFNTVRSCQNTGDQDVEIIKNAKRRFIFHVKYKNMDVIIKSFPLNKYSEKFRYKNYGLSELYNNRLSREKGIPSPEYFGYFEIKSWGMVNHCGIVMDYLKGHVQLKELYKENEGSLFLAIPILTRLYQTGVNHIDGTLNNFFFNAQNGHYAIIDWQYCSIINPLNEIQLIVQAAHFLKSAKVDIQSEVYVKWVGQLHQESCTNLAFSLFSDNISKLIQEKQTIKDRLSLNLTRLGIRI